MRSEPNLNPNPKPGVQYWKIDPALWDREDLRGEIQYAMTEGLLVPVERCKHGYLDAHHWYESGDTHEPTFCPGAGIGGDDE